MMDFAPLSNMLLRPDILPIGGQLGATSGRAGSKVTVHFPSITTVGGRYTTCVTSSFPSPHEGCSGVTCSLYPPPPLDHHTRLTRLTRHSFVPRSAPFFYAAPSSNIQPQPILNYRKYSQMPAFTFLARSDADSSNSSDSISNPVYIAGIVVAAVIGLGIAVWLGLRAYRKRVRNRREEKMGAAFLSVKGARPRRWYCR